MNLICLLFGHSFTPRYDKSAAVLPERLTKASEDALESMRTITYRGDICKRCGVITNIQQVKP